MASKNKAFNYSIVSFIEEDDTISLVPSNWLTPDKTHCFWPPYPAGSAIKNKTQHKANWSRVAVEIIEENIGKLTKTLTLFNY